MIIIFRVERKPRVTWDEKAGLSRSDRMDQQGGLHLFAVQELHQAIDVRAGG